MKYVLFILALLLPLWAYADSQPPIIYTKTIVKIIPKLAPAKVVNATKEDKKEDTTKPSEILPELARVSKEFNVEVRPLQFLAQRDFIAHQPFTDKEGMLILIDPPQQASLNAARLLAKVDVFFINEDGIITKIAPDLALSTLDEPINSDNPLHAFLFLKAGMSKTNDIKPGDRVESSFFKKHPIVLQ
jgi:uncharacterized membrane protein (UPF0127 family)